MDEKNVISRFAQGRARWGTESYPVVVNWLIIIKL